MTALFFDAALLPDGWATNVAVVVVDGHIARVTPNAEPPPDTAHRHGIALPGMPNIHSHAFQRGMSGLAETRGPASDNFWTWREQMYRFALTMTPDDIEAVAAQLYMEMLEAGFTRVGEFHYLHHDLDGRPYANAAEMAERIAAASATAGIGLSLLPVFYAHGGFGGAPAQPGQRRFVSDLDGFARLFDGAAAALRSLGGATLGIAPHSLRAVTATELHHLVRQHPDGRIHIHAAEQTREVDDCLIATGKRPVQWLLDEMGADRRWCFIHATHMTASETQEMARAGVVAGLCPVTEANLGDGIFPAPEFIGPGGRFGIGSDSNILIGVADELRQLEYAQRLRLRARNVLPQIEGQSTGRALYDGARAGGSAALGVPDAGLAAGAPADIVTLNHANLALAGRHGDAALDAWIFATRGNDIEAVWRAGRQVVAGGQHVQRTAIASCFAATMRRLLG